MTTHDEQRRIWNEEHAKPHVLLQMDSGEASGGVVKFMDFLAGRNLPRMSGLEMGCGKGRNVIWLALHGVEAHGFDFAETAIAEGRKRATDAGLNGKEIFSVADATARWPYADASFDFGVDCFASTDIESPEGRRFAISEMLRVLKPGGHLMSYLLSMDDEFQKEMIEQSPAGERGAFTHPTGKWEKSFTADEIKELYQGFELVIQERMAKTSEFNGKKYASNHFWTVFRKP
ncbi:MAG: class I SAM-dependent methyltransferase [Candidatus Kaiserbacteria bacterium]|nr:class I SAM-dependent methyltransferase [Candidatus Kaiserbacteria bacterium]